MSELYECTNQECLIHQTIDLGCHFCGSDLKRINHPSITDQEIEEMARRMFPKPIQLNSLAFDIQNNAVREKERNAAIKAMKALRDKIQK